MIGIIIGFLLSSTFQGDTIAQSTVNSMRITARFVECPRNLCKCYPSGYAAKCVNNARRMQEIPILPTYVRKLILSSNRFPTVSRSLLEPLAPLHLTRLTIKSSVIVYLEDDCFRDLEHLEDLDLSSNDKVNTSSLRRSLQSLRLTNLGTLRFERMEWNSTHLSENLFSKLAGRNVERISLKYNKIDHLSPGSMDGLENLIEISLANNILKSCEETLKDLHSLRKIDLSFNKLTQCEIKHIPNTVKRMQLRNNLIDKIPNFCSENSSPLLKELQYLSFENNLIEDVKREDFSCFRFLKHLSLRGNIIRRFSSYLFADLPILETLHLNDMKRQVRYVASTTFSITSLKKLLFQGNGFSFRNGKQLGKASFENCTSLEYLDLSHNLLPVTTENLNYLIRGLNRLKKIRLFKVGWQHIPDSFFRVLPNVEEVVLSHNRISSLNSSVFIEKSKIKQMRLDANDITHIGPSTFTKSFWGTVQRLDLSGNPFACNCDLLWFRDKLRNPKNIKFLNYPVKYTCLSPPEKKDLLLSKFSLSEEECKTKSEIVTALITSASVCVVVLLCSVVVYKGRWHLRYWVYLIRFQRSEQTDANNRVCKYDAFIIYAEEDSNFVHDILLPKLETDHAYKLCIHLRDFVPGKIIFDNIAECMSESRHVVVILSRNFCKSKWCKFELTIAQDRWLNSESEAPVLAMLEEADSRHMTREMRALIKTTTYVLWTDNEQGQTLFWEQLRSSLEK